MAEVKLERIEKVFDDSVVAVSDINLTINSGDFVVLVGPSGCGKSTTLRMIAGLESISSGQLYIDGKLVNDVHPKDRDIAMVFQNYALYPHMTVYENMAFGLKLKRTPKPEIKRRVLAAAEAVDMVSYLERRPKALSGGQRQRVALGRAIVRNPKVFLFDEPLSNLDAKLRVQMRVEIAKLQNKMKTTTIYVTHDQTEAMTMADKIAVLKDGILQQYDTPLNTYNRPMNQFVAGFIGSPAMNFIKVSTVEGPALQDGLGTLKIDFDWGRFDLVLGQKLILGIRPEDIWPQHETKNNGEPAIDTSVITTEPMGNETFLHLEVGSGSHQLMARVRPERLYTNGQKLKMAFDTKKIHLFDITSGNRIN